MFCTLSPACKDYLWGGSTLKTKYAKQFDGPILAETWELSCHEDGLSVIASGPFAGQTLKDYLAAHPQAAGSAASRFEHFPVLIKLIDAAKNLSVQVHPDNAFARAHEAQDGKTEMWYVIDAAPGAYLYYGVAHPMNRRQLDEAIRTNTLCEHLRKVEVHRGDVFFLPPGTIHAIGAGVLVAEVQQTSNLTYRVYDYGRVDADGHPRALHIEKACQVATLHPIRPLHSFDGHLGKCKYFTVDLLSVDGRELFCTDGTSFHSLLLLSGEAEVCADGQDPVKLRAGDSLFVGADTGAYTFSGRCEVLWTRVEPQRYRIGIDLGGTGIKAGVVDTDCEIIARAKRETRAGRPWQNIVQDMAGAALEAVEKAGLTLGDCDGVGIGIPGTIDTENGRVVFANNLGWENVPFAQEFHRYIPLPLRISNDANCAALGEVRAGAARGYDSAVLLTLGTGVGGGVVADGKLFEGGPGGMELGHTTLIAGGVPCTCGRQGCIESYCSATALIREANAAADAHPDSLLAAMRAEKGGEMDGIIPFAAMRRGDDAARAVVEQYIHWLGEAVTNFVNIFRPEVVLLSGGICGEGEALTDPLNDYVRRNAYAGHLAPVPPVLRAKLGNDAGLIGAACLVEGAAGAADIG